MVRKLIASAGVVVALGLVGWGAGADLGDPFRARKPLPRPKPLVAAGCQLLPKVVLTSPLDKRLQDLDADFWEHVYLPEQLTRRTAELSDCARQYGEPGAEQFARVTVSHTGEIDAVEVQGPFVSDALITCVQDKVLHWKLRKGPVGAELTLPVQYCPGS